MTVQPSHWNYIWYYVFIITIPIGLIKRSSTIMRISDNSITVEQGLFSKQYKEISITSLRSVSISQSFSERFLNIGTLKLSTSGESGYDVVLPGLPDPKGVRDFINSKR